MVQVKFFKLCVCDKIAVQISKINIDVIQIFALNFWKKFSPSDADSRSLG